VRNSALVFVVASLVLTAAVSAQDALSLLHRMQAALGGADKIAAIADYEQEVAAESFDGRTGRSMGVVRKRTRWIRPTVIRVDQVGPGSTYVLYFDGTSGWEILPGTAKVVPIAGGELTFARKYVQNFKLLTWLADRDPRFRISSPAPNVVRLATDDPTDQTDITLDAGSLLPSKISILSFADPAHPVPSDEITTEWVTVEGIRFQRRWAVYRTGVRVAAADDARYAINTGLKREELAAQPPDAKPVFSSRRIARSELSTVNGRP
jgi:hypothetical protein